MTSGRKTLHNIDRAITKARRSVTEASALPTRAGEALINVQRKQAKAYEQIASDRLKLIEDGDGGSLGYVDRQAEKFLAQHAEAEALTETKITAQLAALEALEAARRDQEVKTADAIDAFDKKVAATEVLILKDPDYEAQLGRVEEAEMTLSRAEEKLGIAIEDEAEKGAPYVSDPFFAYLQKRQYGTKHAKGWFLTKALDGWVARKCGYRQAAENYRRLTAIPMRLQNHVDRLGITVTDAQTNLAKLESDILRREGVDSFKAASLTAQKSLDDIDANIETLEAELGTLRSQQSELTSGQSGPFREAITLLTDTLERKDLRSLRSIAAQTRTREDDRAIEELRSLSRTSKDLREDQEDARRLLKKYQDTLSELEHVRRKFKQRRYDAPSSQFGKGDLLGALLGQVLAGALSGNDFWRQLERAQHTIRRYSDPDFGGGDWTEGLRLPRG